MALLAISRMQDCETTVERKILLSGLYAESSTERFRPKAVVLLKASRYLRMRFEEIKRRLSRIQRSRYRNNPRLDLNPGTNGIERFVSNINHWIANPMVGCAEPHRCPQATPLGAAAARRENSASRPGTARDM